jgi:predicted SnoaL-like aldol condensation-catalyzing enzyme
MSSLITGQVGSEQDERWPEYLRPDYIQHKPNVADGPQGVIDFMRANYARYPRHTVEVVRSFVDGNYVFLHVHVHMQPFNQDVAVMDIFRVADGKLAEHWDVDQLVPTEMMHTNGMF